ncbi:hypothetical protein Tco_1460543, partial [Tanacetum coccineum]
MMDSYTGNKTVRDGQLEFADFVAVDKRQSRLPSPFIQVRLPYVLGLVEILRDVLGLVEILRDVFSPPLEYTAVGPSKLVERHETESERRGRDWCASSIYSTDGTRAGDDRAWSTVKNAQ